MIHCFIWSVEENAKPEFAISKATHHCPLNNCFSRFHAYRGRGSCAEAPGRVARGPAGLRGGPACGGPAPGRQAAHDPTAAPANLHQGSAALLQHQTGRQSAHAQTVSGAAGGQGLTPHPRPALYPQRAGGGTSLTPPLHRADTD